MKKVFCAILTVFVALTSSMQTARAQSDSRGITERLQHQFAEVQNYWRNELSVHQRGRNQIVLGSLTIAAGSTFAFLAEQHGLTILSRLSIGAAVLGFFIIVDGAIYQNTDGKIGLLQNAFLPKPAHAATLTARADYYMSTPVSFAEFLGLDPQDAYRYMHASEDLANVVTTLSMAIKDARESNGSPCIELTTIENSEAANVLRCTPVTF